MPLQSQPPPPPPPPNLGHVGGGQAHGPGNGFAGPPPAQQRPMHQQMGQPSGAHGPNGLNPQLPGGQMPMGFPGMHPITFQPTYYGVNFAKVTDRASLGGRPVSWALANKTELPLSSEELAKQVRTYRGRTRKSVLDEYGELRSDKMRMQIDTLLAQQRHKEQNPHADWTLASIEVKYRTIPGPGFRTATEAYLMNVILRRSSKHSDGSIDDAGYKIGSTASETVDVDSPRIMEPKPTQFQNHALFPGSPQFPNPPNQGQMNQRMQGQQMQGGQGHPQMQGQQHPQQQQHQQQQQGGFQQPGPVQKQGKMGQQMPQDMFGNGNQMNKAAIHQGTPKMSKANGQPLGPQVLDYDSDDDDIPVRIIDGKNKQKKYPSVPRPPTAQGFKGQNLSRKTSFKNMQDPRRMSAGQEVLVVRDPKLNKVEKDVKNLKKAMGRKNVTDSDLDSETTETTDESYNRRPHDTPDSSADDDIFPSHRRRRARGRRLSDSWNGKRRMSNERIHTRPPVLKHRSPSSRRRMSLSMPQHPAGQTVVEIPVTYRAVPVPGDYQDRPQMERRGSSYVDQLDYASRPRGPQRSITFDNHFDMARDRNVPSMSRPFTDELDDRDQLAREYMARSNGRSKDLEYLRRGEMLDEARRRESTVRAMERMELERIMNLGDEDMESRRVFERQEVRKKMADLARYEDMLRLEEKMKDLRASDLLQQERARRNDSSIGYGMY